MAMFQKIISDVTHEGQLCWITLNANKGNILDIAMMTEMVKAIELTATNPLVKAIAFKANGDHFSFGASVKEHEQKKVATMLSSFHRLFRVLIRSKLPLLAAVRGQCLGGAMELITFCHWVFCEEKARFGQPEINLGVFPPVASLLLPYRVGQAATDDLILTGRSIDANEAEKIGLINNVSSNPEKALQAFFENHLVSKSAIALRFSVETARTSMVTSFLQNLELLEQRYVNDLMETQDANEGIAAFIEKRDPLWRHR